MRIEGIITFETGLPLNVDCMNKEFSIIINNQLGVIATPCLPPDYAKKPPPDIFDNLLKPQNILLDNIISWGHISVWPTGHCFVNAFAIWFDIKENIEELIQNLFDYLGNWRKLFIDNISVIAQISIRKEIVNGSLNVDEIGQYCLYGDDGIKLIKYKDVILHSPTYLDGGITLKHLEDALAITSTINKPVLEFYFLLQAIEAFKQYDYRKSVLDSATALELCLVNLISINLKLDELPKKEILGNYNSMYKKRMLLKSLNVVLPDKYNYKTEFDDIRNKAIHKGKSPTKDEAWKVYLITKEILETLMLNKFEPTFISPIESSYKNSITVDVRTEK